MKYFGIVNITPDSFSDGGECSNLASIINRVEYFINAGCYCIDVGAQSTRPSAVIINEDAELARLVNILPHVVDACRKAGCKTSIDTFYPKVAEFAVNLGIDYINDVTGGSKAMYELIVRHPKTNIIVMHNLGVPPNKSIVINSYQDVSAWFEKKISDLTAYGIPRDGIILDVGIGFGKTAEHSMEIIRRIDTFTDLAKKHRVRLMVGHSRKSFLKHFSSANTTEQLDILTSFISSAFLHNVDYIRTHRL